MQARAHRPTPSSDGPRESRASQRSVPPQHASHRQSGTGPANGASLPPMTRTTLRTAPASAAGRAAGRSRGRRARAVRIATISSGEPAVQAVALTAGF